MDSGAINLCYDWKNYYILADKIEKTKELAEPETIVRNIVSRLFCHAFRCIENYAKCCLSYSPASNNIQGKLMECLKRNKKYNLANLYKGLKEIRTECDYHSKLEQEPEKILENSKTLHKQTVGLCGKYCCNKMKVATKALKISLQCQLVLSEIFCYTNPIFYIRLVKRLKAKNYGSCVNAECYPVF